MKLLMSTKQFKMYLDDDLVARLENLAEKGGRRSAQQVAEEILLTYLPVWSAVTDATNRAIRFQTENQTPPVLYAESDLAPVAARIGSGDPEKDEAIRRLNEDPQLITTDQIAAIKKQIKPRRASHVGVLKQKARSIKNSRRPNSLLTRYRVSLYSDFTPNPFAP